MSALKKIIKQKIDDSENGNISFRDYMNMVLYYPNLGYYASSKEKVSEFGDFITATSQTSIFASTFAGQFAPVLKSLGHDVCMVEFGAGTGKFAVDCMAELERLGQLPNKYIIIELSNDLKLRQQENIQKNLPHLFDRFEWLVELPSQKIKAVVFANEVLDAMAVDIFKAKDNVLIQQGVQTVADEFELVGLRENDKRFDIESQHIMSDIESFEDGYTSELNTWIRPWAKSIADTLEQGMVFLCDYGYDRKTYYMSERSMGTLACYHQHKVNYDPFINIGEQDVTAHVDFTAVAEAFTGCGFELDGYMTQANFLKNANVAEVFLQISQRLNETDRVKYSKDLKELLLGDKLAETFKVFCCSKDFDEVLGVFDNEDNIDYVL